MDIRYDRDDDVAYVRYIREKVDHTEEITGTDPNDVRRLVDWTATGKVIGIEFLDVENGVLTAGLPVDVITLQQALEQAGIRVLDPVAVSGSDGFRFGDVTGGTGAEQDASVEGFHVFDVPHFSPIVDMVTTSGPITLVPA